MQYLHFLWSVKLPEDHFAHFVDWIEDLHLVGVQFGIGTSRENKNQFARFYDAKTGKETQLFDFEDRIDAFAYSPKSKRIAVGEGDGTVSLFSIQPLKKVFTVPAHRHKLQRIVFAPDGKSFATASTDGVIQVWDIEKGKNLAELKGHKNNVNSMAISADSKLLISAGSDISLRFWNLESKKQLTRVDQLYDFSVNTLSLSPDEKWLAVGGANQSDAKLFQLRK